MPYSLCCFCEKKNAKQNASFCFTYVGVSGFAAQYLTRRSTYASTSTMITRCKLEQKKNLRQPQDTPKTLKSDCFSTSVKVSGSIGRSKSHAPRHVHTYVKISGQAARNVNFASLRGAGRQLIVMLAQKKICFPFDNFSKIVRNGRRPEKLTFPDSQASQ